MNKGLFDIIMFGFTQYPKNVIISHGDEIKETMISMMVNDSDFIDSISGSGTDQKEKVLLRFDKWLNVLRNITKNDNQTEPRIFSWSYKKQLWDTNPVCAICNQRIQTIDDAEIDHIEPYSMGGKTTFKNARLVHRYCNRSRSLKGNNYDQINKTSFDKPVSKGDHSQNYHGRIQNVARTKQSEFRVPILKSLIELGGKGTVKEVLKKVEIEMRKTLNGVDYEKTPSRKIRWENTAEWERNKMRAEKLISSTSPRGIWEITENGRQYFAAWKAKLNR
jgi:hypothetical protein